MEMERGAYSKLKLCQAGALTGSFAQNIFIIFLNVKKRFKF